MFCTQCDHQAWLNRAALPDTLLVRRVTERLRCTVCGSKSAEIRIVYTGAGDFHWGYPNQPPTRTRTLKALHTPFDPALMATHPVSRAVNNTRNDDPSLVESLTGD